MLAMVVNDNAVDLTPQGVLRFFASKLAPTAKGPAQATNSCDTLPQVNPPPLPLVVYSSAF
ncbi:hypothetical protein BZ163_32190 [Pseudomonas sp. VI4.1]|nr:hypothetical protein BZ163_32190 [Pseudomonas sp. VI4.1]